jgi:hypothetical protein
MHFSWRSKVLGVGCTKRGCRISDRPRCYRPDAGGYFQCAFLCGRSSRAQLGRGTARRCGLSRAACPCGLVYGRS